MSDDSEREVTIEEEADSDSTAPDSGETVESDSLADGEAVDADSLTEENSDAEGEETTVSGESEDLDTKAASFLEVEQEIDAIAEGMQVRGQAIDVEQIPAHEVPEGFPYEITTDDALALTLELPDTTSEKTVTTYFDWPTEGTGDRLGRLLELREVPLDRFADLHGETLLLTVEDGHFVPVLPDEEPRGDGRAVYGILAGLLPSLAIFAAAMLGGGGFLVSNWFVLLYLAAHIAILPAATYLDAWHLRTTTNWEGGPLFWAFFAMIPGLNLLVLAAYLIARANAEPIL